MELSRNIEVDIKSMKGWLEELVNLSTSTLSELNLFLTSIQSNEEGSVDINFPHHKQEALRTMGSLRIRSGEIEPALHNLMNTLYGIGVDNVRSKVSHMFVPEPEPIDYVETSPPMPYT